MNSIDVFIRHPNTNLQKISTLSIEGDLVYNDEGGDFQAHLITSVKFAFLTIGSPLFALAHLVRSAVFLVSGQFDKAGREFIGAFAALFLASVCLAGTLLSSAVYVISAGNVSFYVSFRRMYANVEGWINDIDYSKSYSHRVSSPLDCCDASTCTTAPCMQPMLERGVSEIGGILDRARIGRILHLTKMVDHAFLEGKNLILELEA